MKVSFCAMSIELRSQFIYGVKDGSVFFIPYTGWGNTACRLLYEKGVFANHYIATDWQWGGTEDRYPDGEVFQSLEEAISFAGYPVDVMVQANPSILPVGGLKFLPVADHAQAS